MSGRITHVWVKLRGKHQMLLALDEFLSLDPEQRAYWILDGYASFLDASGQTVPMERALERLRESWLPAPPEAPSETSTSRLTPVPSTGARGAERRRYERTSLVRPVRVVERARIPSGVTPIRPHVGDWSSYRVGISRDVSRGGIAFLTRRPHAEGEMVAVGWSAGPASSETRRWGRVVRCGPAGADSPTGFRYRVAVAFSELRAA